MKKYIAMGLALVMSLAITVFPTVYGSDLSTMVSYDEENVIWFDEPLEEGFWKLDPNLNRKDIYVDENGNNVQKPYIKEGTYFTNADYYEYLWTKGLPLGNGKLGATVMGAVDKEVIQVNEDTVWTGSPYVDKDGNLTGGSRKDGWKVYRGQNEDGTPAEIGTKEGTVSYESLNIDNTPELSFDESDLESIKKFEEDAREAVEARKNLDCLVEKQFLGEPVKQKAYQSFVEAFIDFGHERKNVSGYNKRLDMKTAVATVEYDYDNVHYTRESFVSYPSQAVITKINASKGASLNFEAELHTFHLNEDCNPTWRKISDNEIALTAKVQDGLKEGEVGNESKIKFEARMIIDPYAGYVEVSEDNKSIKVSGTDNAVIYIVGATNFVDFMTLDDTKPFNDCEKYSNALKGRKYTELLKEHLADYQPLYNRSSLSIENNSDTNYGSIQTQERARISTKDGKSGYLMGDDNTKLKSTFSEGDNALATLVFNFGKYLMITGSRETTEGGAVSQPLNLQGIWNSTNSPSWNGKFTININTEMNYWLAQVLNVGECEKPLLESIKDLAVSGSVTAREQYAITDDDGIYQPGDPWVMHHNFDLWRGTQPIDNATAGVWPTGGIWLLDHAWQYYKFNLDEEYLSEFYPLMIGACKFFTQFLVVDEKTGYLVTAASVSPEHGGIQPGAAMDTQLIRNLYNMTIEASEILGKGSEDKELLQKVSDQLNGTNGSAMVAPDLIDDGGFIREWTRGDVSYDLQKQKADNVPSWTLNEYQRNEDGTYALDKDGKKIVIGTYDMKYHGAVNNDGHKHCSHMWQLFPGSISAFSSDEKEKEIFEAYKKTAIAKDKAGQGWGLAWRTNLRARILDGAGAYEMVKTLLSTRLSPNMFDQHPNFQIDGNYGFSAGVAEMLLQSHDEAITILPALPNEWSKGEFNGFRARNGFEVSVKWDEGQASNITLKSLNGKKVTLRCKGLSEKNVVNSQGNKVDFNTLESVNGFDIITFDTVQGETYSVY